MHRVRNKDSNYVKIGTGSIDMLDYQLHILANALDCFNQTLLSFKQLDCAGHIKMQTQLNVVSKLQSY